MNPRAAKALNLLTSGFLVAALACTFGISAAMADAAPEYPTVSVAYRGAAMLKAHDCWTHDGPKGVIPGHAVVDRGLGPELVNSSVGFGIWLDGKPGTVLGFCS